tara:strand:+ start:374 stop:511 length:138 start_codon:yes stop_codon:yes gene_type:complete
LEIALPEGSFMFWKDLSHSKAIGVLHATEGTDGTVEEAVLDGKCS